MSEKQYPLHHDNGTVTISRDVFESMTAELERLRPMECSLELAEADRDAYKKKVEELAGVTAMAFCEECPIKGTEYCHKVNPKAKKYTRTEKKILQQEMKKKQSDYKEIEK